MKLIINQNNDANYEEPVTSQVIDKLYNLSKNNALTQDSYLRGRIKATKAYTDAVDYLNEEFGPDLIVSADVSYIRFEDPEVERVLMANNFSSDGIGITTADAAAKPIGNIFQNNTTIRYFDELPYFKNVSGNPTLNLDGCTNLVSIDLTGYLGGVRMYNHTCNPTYFMGKNSTPGYLEYAGSVWCDSVNLTHLKLLEDCPNLRTNQFRGGGVTTLEMVPRRNMDLGAYTFSGHAIQEIHMESIENYWTCAIGNQAMWSSGTKLIVNGTQVTSITIPSDLTVLPGYLWHGAGTLTGIDWNGTQPNITEVKEYVFSQTNIQFGDMSLPVCTKIGNSAFNSGSFGNVNIPAVTQIGSDAFYGCSMSQLTISHILNTIGNNAFNGITLPRVNTDDIGAWLDINFGNRNSNPLNSSCKLYVNGIETTQIDFTGKTMVKPYVFADYTSLTTVNIPNTVTSIGDGAFQGCSGLTTINIPNTIIYVGANAFGGTPWYNSLPSGEVYIGAVLYKYKTPMPSNTSISVQSGTKIISGSAFEGFSQLVSITMPNSVESIGIYAFRRCSNLASVTLSNTMTEIGEAAFAFCSSLHSITIPNSVTTINKDAFDQANLTSITIPDSVTTIGPYAFQDNYNLSTAIIGSGITTIGTQAFENISTLAITIYATTPPTLGLNVFRNISSLEIYVPSESLDAYKAANGWKAYKDYIQAIPNT